MNSIQSMLALSAVSIMPFGHSATIDSFNLYTLSGLNNTFETDSYDINGSTDSLPVNISLQSVGSSSVGIGDNPNAMAINFQLAQGYADIFIISNANQSISAFKADLSGKMQLLGEARTTGYNPSSIALDPSSTHVYVTSYENNHAISMYSFDATSGLQNIGSIAVQDGLADMTIDPSGQYAYAINNQPNDVNPMVYSYAIDPTGALTALDSIPASLNDYYQKQIVIDSAGKHAYVLNQDGKIALYNISSGHLSPMTPAIVAVPVTTDDAFAMDPYGRYLEVISSSENALVTYSIDSETGALNYLAATPVSNQAQSNLISVDPTGQLIYIASGSSSKTSVFWLDPNNGVLNQIGTFAVGAQPHAIAAYNTAPSMKPTYQVVVPGCRIFTAINYTGLGSQGLLTINPVNEFNNCMQRVCSNLTPQPGATYQYTLADFGAYYGSFLMSVADIFAGIDNPLAFFSGPLTNFSSQSLILQNAVMPAISKICHIGLSFE